MTINQINSTIVISTSQVKSVGEYIILFNARLITFAIDNYSASGYTTDNYKTVFQFLNSNWVILSTNINYYVKINQLSIFTLEFYDQENDRIVIILEQYDEIGLYSQQDPSSKQKIKLFLQANSYSENPINIVATYTDSYHQDSSFYNKLNFTIYTFLVDPPLFENNLETFNANRCSNYTIVFPRVEDPNGLNSTISISQSNLDWIKLSNNTLFLNTANLDFNISETTVVTLKITNSQKAWREYNQTIVTEQYFRPTFEDMQNVSVSDGILYEFNIKVASKYKVDAVEWDSNILISWISVTNDYSKMYVYYPSQAEHKKWVKLRSYDSWGNPIYSSLFYIVAQKDYNKPPSRWGSFGPLKVYVGDKSLFLIPNDLFWTKNNSKLEYSVSVLNWSIHSSLTVEIKGTDFDDNHYLYVFSNQSKSCMISIKAEDKDHQSSEIYVNVIVISCASKDWISWTNEYQSGWIKWKLNYILDDSGLWILNKLHYPDSINSIFDVWGIITLICLIIQLIMSIRIGFNALLPVEFSQTILIMFALSSLNDANLNQYAAWMQFFKLDFGFLDFLKLRNLNFGKFYIYTVSKN